MVDINKKIELLSGKDEWNTVECEELGINSVRLSDGPHGVRKLKNSSEMTVSNRKGTEIATCFPTSSSLAQTFNKDLAYRVGEGIAKECCNLDVDVILGPGLNIKRNPMCGRNFEYFSEDPFVSGVMATNYVKGVQSLGVGACVKHFACNNQETARFINNSIVDERALREIYLAGFEMVVKEAKPYTIMASYNKLNGKHTTENKWLLTDVLRNEWGFDGLVMSDWGATNSRVEGVKAGLDLDMPGSRGFFNNEVNEALNNETLLESEIDERIANLKTLSDRAKNRSKEKYDVSDNKKLAEDVALESIVLLKNDNFLPLNKEEKVLVVGELFTCPRIQGGGSSDVVTDSVVTPKDAFDAMGVNYDYVECYQLFKPFTNKVELNKTKKLVKNYDKVIVFVGLGNAHEAEASDRETLDLPDSQLDVALELCAANPNTLIVLQNGSPVTMPFLDDASAVLQVGLFGERGANSLAKIIYGEVSPSGRLAETYPISHRKVPSFYTFANDLYTTTYEESIFVGYRYFESAKEEVLFPFGYGLSYSKFDYSNINIKNLGDYNIEVSVDVTNTGNMKAKETVLLFVNKEVDNVYRSVTELKGFEKVELDVNETKTVTIKLNKRSFALFDINSKEFVVEKGNYEISFNKNAHDKIISEVISLDGKVLPSLRKNTPSYYDLNSFSPMDLEYLLNERVQMTLYDKRNPVTYDSTLGEISKKSFIGSKVVGVIKDIAFEGQNTNDPSLSAFIDSFENQTFRSIVLSSSGRLNKELADKILNLVNSEFIDAVKEAMELIKEFKNIAK